jgi:hypothetical protein
MEAAQPALRVAQAALELVGGGAWPPWRRRPAGSSRPAPGVVPPGDVDEPLGHVGVARAQVVLAFGDAERLHGTDPASVGTSGGRPRGRVLGEPGSGRRVRRRTGRRRSGGWTARSVSIGDGVHADPGGGGRQHREQRELLEQVVGVDEGVERPPSGENSSPSSSLARRAQHVAARLGDLERVRAQAGVVGDVDVRLLAGASELPADEAADRLAEEQLGRRGGGVHADPQAWDVDALDTIRTDTSQGRSLWENSAIFFDAVGSSLTTTSAGTLNRLRSSRAMPCAWSWSVAITRPPASGWP